MKFVSIWENCAWVWICMGSLCQILAKKGEKDRDPVSGETQVKATDGNVQRDSGESNMIPK